MIKCGRQNLKLSFSSKIDTKLPQISKHIPVDFCLQFDVQVLLHVNDHSQNEQGKKACEQKQKHRFKVNPG